MAKRKRKLVDVLDVERFEQAKAQIVALGSHLGRKEKLTDAKALRAMVAAAATMLGTGGAGGNMLLVDWTAAQEHIVSSAERLADEIIEAHCRGMSDFLDIEITVKREGKRYSFQCISREGSVLNLVYDRGKIEKAQGVN